MVEIIRQMQSKIRKHFHTHNKHTQNVDLTKGPIMKGILQFAFPLFLGQLLQQFYNMADAWVVGNFADNDAFAAVSSGGSLTFLIIGFFNGIAIGGGVIISRYFGAKDQKMVQKAIHTNFLFGLLASLLATVVGLALIPGLLQTMKTPASVMPHSLSYFRIYFAGVSTVILYNICMSIMRALGDSLHPLYYLIFSSLINVALDLIFVAGFHWGVSGAAMATVFAQGISVLLCLLRMCREPDETIRLDFRKLRLYKDVMGQVICQGLPTGIQNSVISVGNIVIQSNINAFGAYAISGHGAYAKIEGFVFLPIMSMSMVLPTFISQNLGAGEYGRAKKGAAFGTLSGMILAEMIGVIVYIWSAYALRFFVNSEEAVGYGVIHAKTVALFFFLLAFSHCAAGIMRGCGKAFIPMITMLLFWCGVRILYVTMAVKAFPVFRTISWAYPLTWSLSSITFLIALVKLDWAHAFEKKKKKPVRKGIFFLCMLFFLSGCAQKDTELNLENPGIKVTFFDVGKGDAVLIETQRHTMLIDAGYDDTYRVIEDYLSRQRIQRLDYLVITHFDKDHVGGADRVIRDYEVGEILQPDYESDSEQYLEYCQAVKEKEVRPVLVTESMEFTLDEAQFYLYPPQEKSYEEEDNDFSLVVSMSYGDKTFLFAGDSEKVRLQELLEQKEFPLPHDVLKVPHHGKKEKNSEDFFRAVSPELAVITCSEEQPASEKVCNMLKESGTEIYLTSDGTVTCLCDGKSLQIVQEECAY